MPPPAIRDLFLGGCRGEDRLKQDPFRKREAKKYANPIASREFILQTLEKLGEPASLETLSKKLDCTSDTNREALRIRLKAMVRDGQLVVDSRQIFSIASRVEMKTGKVSAHADGFGFLITDEEGSEDVYLSYQQMKQVFHGDKALVRLRGLDRRGRLEGEIVEVLERSTRQLVGRLYPLGDAYELEPSSKRIPHGLLVSKENTAGASSDQIVVAEIITQPGRHEKATARVVEILGDHLTPGLEVDIALRNNDIPSEFPPEVIEEADQLPFEVIEEDKSNRKDLTGVPFVTIDGEDAKDFDDAVYCKKKKDGWRLSVAIADVSHYIKPDTPLDSSALDRGTSVYFPQYVVPMLPEKLSNGLCSLRPDVERLVLVCEMTISGRGRLSSYKFCQGVIRSFARLTYTQVNQILEDDGGGKGESEQELDADVLENLNELKALYLTLDARRKERGALDLDTVELGFEFDEDGRLSNISPRKRYLAHRLIEECMLCANVSAARFLGKHGIAGLYRVHERPESDRVERLREFLNTLGINLGGGLLPEPGDMQRAIEELQKIKSGQIFQMAILRSLQQAKYQRENKGHFGLNYKEYAHFTSPIRRYPDLITHRLIKTVIHSRKLTGTVERFGKRDAREKVGYSESQIDAIGAHTSMAERRADAAVYEVLDWIKCDYLEEHIGDIFEGVVTGVAAFGMFVELKELYVEGLIHVSTLKGDYFNFDSAYQCLTGDRTGHKYGLGDLVTVQVASANPEDRKIDFELVTHEGTDKRKESGKTNSKKGGRKKGASTKKKSGTSSSEQKGPKRRKRR